MSDMREILFRGRTLIETKWVVGDLSRVVHDDGRCYVFPADGYDSPDFYEVDPETVGEYTGLTDDNGAKIFEGDLIEYDSKTFEMKYIDGFATFDLRSVDNMSLAPRITTNTVHRMRVIGNIHDNPELLEGGAEP